MSAGWQLWVTEYTVGTDGPILAGGRLVGRCGYPAGTILGPIEAVDPHGDQWHIPAAVVTESRADGTATAVTNGPFARLIAAADEPVVVGGEP